MEVAGYLVAFQKLETKVCKKVYDSVNKYVFMNSIFKLS